MSETKPQAAIDSVLREERVFPPPDEFSRHAHVPDRARYDALYRWSVDDPEGFWREMAGRLRWMTPFKRVLDWQLPFAQWFVGGRLNIADNCLDRHLSGPRRNKAALIWEGEPGEQRVLTYHALHREVCRFANVLKGLGVGAGDRVGIYLPMIPEAAIAMLACARIGATHSVVFGCFSAEALRARMNDAEASELDTVCGPADIGGGTRHTSVVDGPLASGATSGIYEGAPKHPEPDRFWRIIEELGVSVFYTAPTAIRAFCKWGEEWPRRHDLSSLRLLGTVGEPINPEAWMWYHRLIGGERCPIVDTWWQTETGGIMISPLPGAIPTKPGSATLPLPGIVPEVRSRDGKVLGPNQGGYLVIARPWPGMLRTVWKDPERYQEQYWSQMPGVYFTGDGARRDADGYFWVMGRIDDVVNVAGHRLGTMEVESSLVSHPAVAEAAVVGRPDELKGQAIAAFVTLESSRTPSDELKRVLREHVAKEIGAFARPDDIRFTDALPKTRSGKIMRRLLRDIAAGKETAGDTTTLEDYSVLARLREEEE